MRDPEPAKATTRPDRRQVCDQIGRSVGTLWQRRFGLRPASVATVYEGDVVRCTIESDQTDDGSSDAEPKPDSIDSGGYQNQAQAAVANLTGRTVVGFIAKDKAGAPATNAFILEPKRVKH